ncbi:N12 class adenine-specific DNA methylase [Acidovorax soli]|uniref:N12 class adenine-specific DNA methylase n=1 Tax=Acidovorax soli TaxID=592050 RepID=A0A7X0U923_9BURK|nr:PLxRFG domain-containing protein [Acidovorax soli]MBB6559573.1 N12 class adenine-specific DNA methylase [Acidovorax soli]
MSEVDKFLDGYGKAAPAGVNAPAASSVDELMKSAPAQDKGMGGFVKDAALSLAKGVVAVPEAAVGLGDIVTGGRVGKVLENDEGDLGFRPKLAKEFLGEMHTEKYKEQQAQFQQADGIIDKTMMALSNPSLIANPVIESLPAMGAGGAMGRAGLAAGRGMGAIANPTTAAQAARQAGLAGAAGEGVSMAGSQAEAIRQETPDGLLTPAQAGAAALTGVIGTAVGAGSARLARYLGIGDADTMLAQGAQGVAKQFADDAATAAVNAVAKPTIKSIPRKVLEGAITEGFLEELPQSLAETVLKNLALGKPWHEKLDEAAVMGVLTGGAMGAGAAGIHGVIEPSAPAAPAKGMGAAANSDAPGGLTLAPMGGDLPAEGGGLLPQDEASALTSVQRSFDPREPNSAPPLALLPKADAEGLTFDAPPVQTPSQAMGLDPEAGSMSAAAVLAVDSGAAGQVAQLAQEQAQAEIEAKSGKKAADQGALQAAASLATPMTDEDGVILDAPSTSPTVYPSYEDAQAYVMSQRRNGATVTGLPVPAQGGGFTLAMKGTPEYQQGLELRAQRDQAKRQGVVRQATVESPVAAQAAMTPAPVQAGAEQAAGGLGAASGNDATSMKVIAAKQIPDMTDTELQRAAAHYGPEHKRTAKLQKEIQRRAAAVSAQAGSSAAQGQPQAASVQPTRAPTGQGADAARRIDEAGERWQRMTTVEREALAERSGVKPILRKNLPRAKWQDLNLDLKGKLADLIAPPPAASQAVGDEKQFAPETGTLGVPRADMPQVPTASHGGLVKHLNAQGIAHETTTVNAADLKPTQSEYSPSKVEQAKGAAGGRSIIVSSDGHIIDGHHQAMAAAEEGKTVKAIVLDAPVDQALDAVRNSPSAALQPDSTPTQGDERGAPAVESRPDSKRAEKQSAVDKEFLTEAQASEEAAFAKAAREAGMEQGRKKSDRDWWLTNGAHEFELSLEWTPAGAVYSVRHYENGPTVNSSTSARLEMALKDLAEFRAEANAAQQSAKGTPTKSKKAAPSKERLKAQADVMAALADLGDILGKGTRLNMMPEQEAKLMPVLTRLLDAAFRLGYHKFKDSAKFALDQMRQHLGDEAAEAITLDHLQGAYIGMAGGKKGADSKRSVIDIETKAEIEQHEAVAVDDEQEADNAGNAPSADAPTKEPSNADIEPSGHPADQGRAPEVSGRRGSGDDSSPRADLGDVEARQPSDVSAPADAGRSGSDGVRVPSENVGGSGSAGEGGGAANGRARAGRARAPDAGAGNRSRVKAPEEVSPANPGPGNFHIDNPLEIVGGGQVARFDKNQAAIDLLNAIREDSRQATVEEQRTLAGYTGWGSFGQELFQGTWERPMPKEGWQARDKWLREHLGEDEWKSAQRSITNAHYTDPPTVMAMWDMAKRMGFTGGRVLEPSMGIGNFFGMMPADIKARSRLSGIELDSLTGSMAKLLYPDANVKVMGYQESKTPDDFHDVVIGNWPFENTTIADRRYNSLSPFLHDYFFLKAVDQVRPGGLVIGITSNGTMDKKATRIRAALAKKAELVSAIRLPSGAFQEYAGTKVVTDIVILRKREQPLSQVPADPWINSVAYKTPAGPEVFINEYYVANPGNVIGTTDFGSGTTRMQPGMIVHRPENMAERLKAAVELVPERVYAKAERAKHISYITNHTADREGALTEQDGQLMVVRGEHLAPAEQVRPYKVKSAAITELREKQLRALIDMRGKYAALIEADRSGADATAKRTALREAYEAFTAEHGPLNDSFGLNYLLRLDDPFRPALAALDVNGRPSAILTGSTMRGAAKMENPSAQDAYVLARNRAVEPTIEEIAALAKKPVDEVRAALLESGAVFESPAGAIVPSDIYLSGNVREKLRQAQAALDEGNTAMQRNVDELGKVVPKDIPYFNIESQLGATWVPPKTYAAYVAHMLNMLDGDAIGVTFINGRWKVKLPEGANRRAEASTGFGTSHYPFSKLVNAAMSNQTVKIRRKDSEGNEFLDTEATDEANGKIADMRGKFGEWLWSDPERRVAQEREYNEVRNAYATPKYDGSFLAFEGMALSLGRGPFNLREHQVNAIWRALVNRRSLNGHEVGTGKTFTMGGIAVESRRYGIAKKPVLLAHNANSATVAAEIQQMYPGAKVLYVDNLSPDTIAVKMRQIANDDWDTIVLPHSLIDRLSFREKTLMAMAQEDIRSLEEEAYAAAEDDGVTITSKMLEDDEELKKLRSVTAKELVKARNRIIETIKEQAMRSSKEGAIPFEELGIDMVLVDEVHEFKKPPISTRMNMKGLNTQTSNRSIALQFITRYIRANNNGGNVHTFTGTPITNTLTEIFHQMRYVMEDEMKAAGVDTWDGWFGSFAKEVQDVELSAAGEYEAVTRLAGFINVPELRRMIGQYMDVVFADDMPEMQPRQVNGKTMASADLTEAERAELLNGRTEGATDRPYKKVVNVTSDLTAEQKTIFARLQGYARRWRSMTGKERKEAMASGAPESPIITEGMANKASFDVRLMRDDEFAGQEGSAPDDAGSKASKVVANVMDVYRSSDQATQVIFAEQGYSTSQKRSAGRDASGKKIYRTVRTFSTMRDIVERLVDQGIPREQIAMVDGSTSKEKRKEIADAMNALRIRVVIGSTDTLGVGVNMQRNLRAMHHMDAPYMPGELEQRNGRGLRQGNQWNTVMEYRYMTDRLDGRRWQILAIKQRFITAFLKSNSTTRVIEGDAAADEDNDILQSFSEAAGDPRILIREKLSKNVEALKRAERLHTNGVADAIQGIRRQNDSIAWAKKRLADMTADNLPGKVRDLLQAQANNYRATVGKAVYDSRAEAEEAMQQHLQDNIRMEASNVFVGTYAGQPVMAWWPPLQSAPHLTITMGNQEFVSGSLRGLEAQLRGLPARIEKVQQEIAGKSGSIGRLQEVSAAPFARAADLERAKKQFDALVADIAANPVPPPAWLRAGAPVESAAFRNGKEFLVTGHRWNADGWFVLAQDAKGEMAIPFAEVTDAQGMPVYEPREFEAPEVVTKEAKAPAQEAPKAAPAGDDAVQFARAKLPADGFTPAARQQAVRAVEKTAHAIQGAWHNGPQVIVAFDMNDPVVPDSARRADLKQRSGGARGAPEGFYYQGKVYLIASRLNTPNDAARVLFHEALGHHGLRGAFGGKLAPILNQIATMRKKDVDAKIREYGLRGVNALDRRAAAEEVLAEMAQNTPEIGFVRRAVAAIRTWLRETVPGFSSLRLTDDEIIRSYILPARRFVEQGGPGGGRRDEALMFSIASQPMREASTFAQAKAAVSEFQGKPLVNQQTGFVSRVSRNQLDKMLSNKAVAKSVSPAAHSMAVANVDHLFQSAILGWSKPDDHGNKNYVAIHRFFAPMERDGKVLLVKLTVKETAISTDPNPLYTVEAVEFNEESPAAQWVAASATADGVSLTSILPAGDVLSLAERIERFNTRGEPMFARSKVAELTAHATAELNKTFSAPGKLNWWHKTIGTMYNLAERSPEFKPVFEAAQGFVDDVSHYATDAAELAPRLLPKLEEWRDITKSPVSAADNKAVAKPVFEGTLAWARGDDGEPVRVADLEAQALAMTVDEKAQRLLDRGEIDPGMLRAWQGMPATSYESAINTRYQSRILAAGVIWSDAELRDLFNLTDGQIALYKEFRAATDRSLDTMGRADMLRYGGEDVKPLRAMVMDAPNIADAERLLRRHLTDLAKEKPDRAEQIAALLTGIEDRAAKVAELQGKGYAPLSRFGKYTVDVLVNGERQYFSLFETAAEANDMAAKMRTEFGDASVTQGTISDEAFKLFAGITPESLEIFGNMLGLDSEGDQAQDKAFQEYLRLTKTNRSAMKRLIHRKGIAGYSEDVGRVLASFVYSNSRQTAAGLHMGDLGQAVSEIPQGMGELKDAAMRLAQYVKNPQEEAQAVRGLLFAQYLGGSIASAFVNMSQPAAVTFPWLSQFGGARQAAAELARAAKNIATKGFVYDKDLAASLKAAEDDGTVSPQEVHQLMAQASGRGSLRSGDGTRLGDARAAGQNALARLSVAWGKVFGAAEQVNRRMTFIAAYRVAVAQGMPNAHEFAKRAVTETQFLYSKANKMRFARGAIGGTLMTFKTYSVAYLELLHRMYTQGGPEGKKAALLALGMLMLMGGAGGLPFMEDAEDVVDALAQMMGYNFSSKQARQQLLEEMLPKGVADFIDKGVSGLPGAPLDVSGRLGMGNLIPGTGVLLEKASHTRDVMEIAGPMGDFATRVLSGTRKVLTGDVGAGLLEVSPTAIRNAAKGVDMAATGMYRDAKGYKVLDTNTLEAALKSIGFQPASVATVQEANGRNQQAKNFYNLQAQQIRAKWAAGVFENDQAMVSEARQDIADWNRRNPEQPMLITVPSVMSRVREMRKSKDQRIVDSAPRVMRSSLIIH